MASRRTNVRICLTANRKTPLVMQAGIVLKHRLQSTLHLLPALKLVWQSAPGWTIARIVLIFVQGSLPLALLYLTKLIVDTVSTSLTQLDKSAIFHQAAIYLCLFVIATLGILLCNVLAELVNTAQSQRITDYMHDLLHAKSIEIDLEYYEDPHYYNTLQRAQQSAPYRPPQILDRVAQVGQNSIALIAIIGLLLSLHWGVIGILFLSAVPAVLVRLKYARILYQWQHKRTEMERQAGYFGWLLSSDLFAKEIRLFNLGKFFSQRFRQLRQQIFREHLAIATRRSLSTFAAQTLSSLFLLAVCAFIVYQTIQGALRLGDLVLYYQALQQGQGALKGLLGSLSGLYEDNLFLADLYAFLALHPKVIDPVHPQLLPRPVQAGIAFNNVSFNYATTTRQALKNINLVVRPGETIALVGENGSGKTTLIKLLCRLYDPVSGSITIDGIDLRQFETTALRREISVIFQDYAKYYLSAHDNIWFGNIDIVPGNDTIAAAARHAGADDVITKLPQGYDTILGKLFDQGEELSIGQWQKVALARAFLRDSQVIVLDEPTSAMDPQAEYEVFKTFRDLIKDQAAILITHRLSTARIADRIYVMEHGSMVESGTHEELMRLGGTYAHLFNLQAQNYR